MGSCIFAFMPFATVSASACWQARPPARKMIPAANPERNVGMQRILRPLVEAGGEKQRDTLQRVRRAGVVRRSLPRRQPSEERLARDSESPVGGDPALPA